MLGSGIDKRPARSLFVGVAVSFLVVVLVASQIMQWGGAPLSFSEYLGDPRNIVFTLYYGVLFFSGWLVKGDNNKAFLIVWTVALTLQYQIHWQIQSEYIINNRNIYVFNWAGTIAVFSMLVITKLRRPVSMLFFASLARFAMLTNWAKAKIGSLKKTKFESRMQKALTIWFFWEVILSGYLTAYSITMGLSPTDSIGRTMSEFGHFKPFDWYYLGNDVLTILFCTIILFSLWLDYQNPDNNNFNLTSEEKEKIAKDYMKKIKKRK